MRKSGTGRLVGGWEWCCDVDGVVVTVLMVIVALVYRDCCDNHNLSDAW